MAYNSQQGYGGFGGQGYPNPSAPPPGFNYGAAGGYPPPPQGQGFPQGGYPPPPQGQGFPQGGYPQTGFAQPGQNAFAAQSSILHLYGADPEFKSDGTGVTFSDKSIRAAFIRKVYGILMIQLMVTFGFVALFVLNDEVKLWSRRNIGFFYIFVLSSFVFFYCYNKQFTT